MDLLFLALGPYKPESQRESVASALDMESWLSPSPRPSVVIMTAKSEVLANRL